MGSPDFSLRTLHALANAYDVVGVLQLMKLKSKQFAKT
jgi:hypothetical protein